MKLINKFMNKESEKLAKQLGGSKSDCLKLEWQEFVEKQIWEGEDKYTKNMGVGNVADWWIEKIGYILKSKQEEIEKAIEKMPNATRTEVDIEKVICADDLKPIISNLLLK